MSKKRQPAIFDPQGQTGFQLTTLSHDYADGAHVARHYHYEDQLVFANKGVMTVQTLEGLWVVPPLRAVWIPGRIVHSIRMSGKVSMRTLYFAQKRFNELPRKCLVMSVSLLLRELILHACTLAKLSNKRPAERRVVEMILDQLDFRNVVPLQLPIPNDPRAKRVAEALLSEPGTQKKLQEICSQCGGSKRTIERVFLAETCLGLGKWRQQLRLLHSIRLLAAGEKVTMVALEAGYNSPSAFISAFRKVLGTTPSNYCHADQRT